MYQRVNLTQTRRIVMRLPRKTLYIVALVLRIGRLNVLFWIIAGLMTICAALIVAAPILRRQRTGTLGATSDVAVYRDQLKELDADVARGVLSASEAESSRTEISRRLLAADARVGKDAGPAPKFSSRTASIALLASLIVGGMGLYAIIGSPGTPDQPLSERLVRISQPEAEQRFADAGGQTPRDLDAREEELLGKLRDALADRPDDLEGHRLLAQTLNSIGDFVGASSAQSDVIRILGNEATTDDYAQQAELMIFAAGGYVSPEADQALARALQLNPTNTRARYYSGVSMAQTGKPELAMQLWSGLLREGNDDEPWKEPVRAQMRNLAQSTGLPLPEELLKGPTQDDIDAASGMSEDERREMIRNMVDGLNDRLATEGGTAAEWARLIGALGVLGETERAQAIFDEAKETFASNPDAMQALSEAAQSAGLK